MQTWVSVLIPVVFPGPRTQIKAGVPTSLCSKRDALSPYVRTCNEFKFLRSLNISPANTSWKCFSGHSKQVLIDYATMKGMQGMKRYEMSDTGSYHNPGTSQNLKAEELGASSWLGQAASAPQVPKDVALQRRRLCTSHAIHHGASSGSLLELLHLGRAWSTSF